MSRTVSVLRVLDEDDQPREFILEGGFDLVTCREYPSFLTLPDGTRFRIFGDSKLSHMGGRFSRADIGLQVVGIDHLSTPEEN